MIEATNLKPGATFQISGKPYKVLKYFHQKLGRGGANVRVSVRNLTTGGLEEKTFKSDHKVEEITTVKKPLQFLYKDGSNVVFMDSKNYEQIDISADIIGNELAYIKEGKTVNVLFWSFGDIQGKEDVPLSIEIPIKVTLKVVDTPPGVKGDSATNMYKPAKLENGLQVKVPLFVNKGDLVVVDTRSGEYLERARE